MSSPLQTKPDKFPPCHIVQNEAFHLGTTLSLMTIVGYDYFFFSL